MSSLGTGITENTRLPRYRRAEAEVSFALTQRDLAIIHAVESFRRLTSEHLQRLIEGSDQGILRRLQVLFHGGYLDRLRPRRVENGGSAKIAYAITNKGVQTLQKAGLIQNPSKTDRNAQNRDLHDLSVAHSVLVSHIHATFLLACRQNPNFQFLFWREGRELQDTVEVALPEKYATVPVAPDGFFALRDAQGRLNFFVEADRGTMTLKRFTLKLKAYAAFYQQKKHTDKFGIKHFRVLTVTSSAARCRNLLRAAEAAEDVRKLGTRFLFATEEDLPLSSPESVLTKIWTAPGRKEPYSVV